MQPQPPTPSVQSPPAVLRTVVWCPTWEAPPGDLPPPSDTPGFTWSLALSSAVVWAPSESSAPRVLQKNPFVFPAWQWARQGWGETGVASPPPSHPHSWQDCSFEDVVGLRQNMGFRMAAGGPRHGLGDGSLWVALRGCLGPGGRLGLLPWLSEHGRGQVYVGQALCCFSLLGWGLLWLCRLPPPTCLCFPSPSGSRSGSRPPARAVLALAMSDGPGQFLGHRPWEASPVWGPRAAWGRCS